MDVLFFAVFGFRIERPVADALVDTGLAEAAIDKVGGFVAALLEALEDVLDRSADEAEGCTVRFHDGRVRTGVVIISRGKAIAAIVVCARDSAGPIHQVLRDVDAHDPPRRPSPFSSSGTYGSTPSSPFSSGSAPSGRSDVPLVQRTDLWPEDRHDPDAYEPDERDFLPNWSRTR